MLESSSKWLQCFIMFVQFLINFKNVFHLLHQAYTFCLSLDSPTMCPLLYERERVYYSFVKVVFCDGRLRFCEGCFLWSQKMWILWRPNLILRLWVFGISMWESHTISKCLLIKFETLILTWHLYREIKQLYRIFMCLYVCLYLNNACRWDLARQEAKATMKFQRIIGVTSGGRGAMAALGFWKNLSSQFLWKIKIIYWFLHISPTWENRLASPLEMII